jgi:hypothetical protein
MAGVRFKALPWIYRTQASRVLLVSIASGTVVFIASFGIEYWLCRNGSSPMRMIFASDLFAGILSATVQFITIHYLRQRRIFERDRLNVIAEMNHHIRNALETIQSAAILGGTDREQSSTIERAVARITWALEEILGRESNQATAEVPVTKRKKSFGLKTYCHGRAGKAISNPTIPYPAIIVGGATSSVLGAGAVSVWELGNAVFSTATADMGIIFRGLLVWATFSARSVKSRSAN